MCETYEEKRVDEEMIKRILEFRKIHMILCILFIFKKKEKVCAVPGLVVAFPNLLFFSFA